MTTNENNKKCCQKINAIIFVVQKDLCLPRILMMIIDKKITGMMKIYCLCIALFLLSLTAKSQNLIGENKSKIMADMAKTGAKLRIDRYGFDDLTSQNSIY
jgi:hypothetical protein